MSSESDAATNSDPLKSVADAMDAAVKAAKEGAEDARNSAANALPEAGQFLSRMLYKGSYAISYGVVFPSMLIAKSIPKDNAAVHGLVDGAQAAIDMLQSMMNKDTIPGGGTPPHEGDPLH